MLFAFGHLKRTLSSVCPGPVLLNVKTNAECRADDAGECVVSFKSYGVVSYWNCKCKMRMGSGTARFNLQLGLNLELPVNLKPREV